MLCHPPRSVARPLPYTVRTSRAAGGVGASHLSVSRWLRADSRADRRSERAVDRALESPPVR